MDLILLCLEEKSSDRSKQRKYYLDKYSQVTSSPPQDEKLIDWMTPAGFLQENR
jgi:hypothetical protein